MTATAGLALGMPTGGAASPPVIIDAAGAPQAGKDFVINVIPLKLGMSLGVIVELNRVRLGNVTVNHKKGGSVDLVVRIPAATKRGTVTVTIAAGGQVATKSFKIL